MRARAIPDAWRTMLEANVPYYRVLPVADRRELEGHVSVLLEEKRFEGCRGMEITDTVCVTIAGHAAILLLHRDTDYYPLLHSILVYPTAYLVSTETPLGEGVVVHGTEPRVGESWQAGLVILSWEDVELATTELGGDNVILHEFAHQLDAEDGDTAGTPRLRERHQRTHWSRVLSQEYEALCDALDRGEMTVIDEYAAESPAEFFAVTTECFFEQPHELCEKHPALYAALAGFYCQDPAKIVPREPYT
jgi:hypothetical protein